MEAIVRNFDNCPKCKEYVYLSRHSCELFYFKHEDWGDEFQEIYAFDMDDAAEKFAILYNEGGYYPLMDNEIDVLISDGQTETTYTVSAEPDISYHVQEK